MFGRVRLAIARSLRARILLLILGAFIAFSIPAYISYTLIVDASVVKLGKLFAEKQILFDRHRGLGVLMQEVKLAETLSKAPVIVDWARNEDDPELRRLGIATLEHLREAFADHSYFLGFATSGNYYANDTATADASEQPRDQLSADNPRDAWFYDSLARGHGCHLDVDPDDAPQGTKAWVSCVVRDGETVLGVLAAGIDLRAFVREVVGAPQNGVTALVVNGSGTMQTNGEPQQEDGGGQSNSDSHTSVFALLDRPEDQTKLQQMMDRVASEEGQVESHVMRVDGEEMLVGVGYVAEIGWYNVTVTDIEQVLDGKLFLPLGVLRGVIMMVALATLGFVFKRQVLDRLAQVEARFIAVEGGKISPGPVDMGADEIGRLSRAFASMAEKVSDNTVMLEQRVAERTEELRKIAYLDQMTGIANRRGFIEAFERIRDGGQRLGLLLIDIDAFKYVNDNFGHQAGDQLVTELARRLTTVLRPDDACGRWGGDEFIVAVNGIEPGGLKPVAEAVKDALSAPVQLGDAEVWVTVSVGASEVREGESLEAVVDHADAALYRAKADGRHRAVTYEPGGAFRQSA